ncbi:MAG TPA: hypothetical protein VFH29_03265, partial [Anaerolineales bacterium]|nr:hypothetical protein [Anaerolineales bacterium]
ETRGIYKEMTRLLTERLEHPDKLLVVCTHFGLAHKLAAIKEEFRQREGVRMVLAVCVTDDTFQHIWYVDGADLLVVPSEFTRRKYLTYGQALGGHMPRIEVVPYPVHPLLGQKLDATELAAKTRQLEAGSMEPIHVSIPISGAAVGTEYSTGLITRLHELSDRFRFHIVCKNAPFTQDFLSQWVGKSWVDVRDGRQDREVVNQYDDLMLTQVISLEVTKPSEQTFKCLVPTGSRGGVILLFTHPVGTQEYENMDFLRRHSLVPSPETNDQLWALSRGTDSMDATLQARILGDARGWRGVRIPPDAHEAADFIGWMHASGLFATMLQGNLNRIVQDEESRVLGPDGVAQFWDLAVSV